MENKKIFVEQRDLHLKKAKDYGNGVFGEFACAYDARESLVAEHQKDNGQFYLTAMKNNVHHLKFLKTVGYDSLEYKVCLERFCQERNVDVGHCPINDKALSKVYELLDEVDAIRQGNDNKYAFCDLASMQKNDNIMSYAEILEKYPRFKGRGKFLFINVIDQK